MHVITKKALETFWKEHEPAERPLREWEGKMRRGHFANHTEVKAVWKDADYVDGLTIFNIGGNKYRLIVIMQYDKGQVYIQSVLTHAEYNRNAWRGS